MRLRSGYESGHCLTKSKSEESTTGLKRTLKKESSRTYCSTGEGPKRTVKKESPSTSRSTRTSLKQKAKKESPSASCSTGPRSKRTAKKGSPSTSCLTTTRPKRTAKKNCVQLSDSIWMFPRKRISTHGEIYEGELRSDNCDTHQIVLKLAENTPQNITEAIILAKLNNHSHVLSLIQRGTFNCGPFDRFYMALDKCHDENLREFIMNRKTQGFAFNLSRAIEIAEQMVDGVKYIHENRIIHKDLKPDNILISLDQKLIKIADFGLSQEIDSTSTEVSVKEQFGTNGFRPPESFGEGIISQKTDIFSLGVTSYFVLSNGEHPFGDDSDSWNRNIKNGIINISGLPVSNIKTTEHLIRSMIEHKINHRPTIWQVSEHPFWTGNEVPCDLDYHCPESSLSLIPPTSEESNHNIDDLYKLLKQAKKFKLCDGPAAAKRIKDGDADLTTTEVGSHSAVTYDFHKAVNAIAVFDKNSKAIQAFKPSDKSWTRLHVVTDEIINKNVHAVVLDDNIIVLADDKTNYRLKYSGPEPKWIRLPDRTVTDNVMAVALHDEVYAFHDHDEYSQTIEKLDIHQTSWSQMTKLFPCYCAAVIAVGDFIYTFGGYSGEEEFLREATKFDPNTSTWSNLPSMPTARFNAGAAALDDKIYVMGGYSTSLTPLTTTENFHIQSRVWTTVKPMIYPRQWFNACTIDRKMYAVGGSGLNWIDEYDRDADTWQTVSAIDDNDILCKATISISI